MLATPASGYAAAMAAEIERKFLLGEPPDWLQDCASVPIEQGYVALAEETEVRLRKAGERRLLTVKRGQGEVREEVEIPLGEDQFDALWPLTARRQLAKTRFLVALEEGLEAEVDVFEGDLKGLAVAEVEFESERQSGDFEAPRWLGEEITGDPRYANRELALRGLGMLGPPQDGNSKDMSSAVHSKSYRLKEKERADEGSGALLLAGPSKRWRSSRAPTEIDLRPRSTAPARISRSCGRPCAWSARSWARSSSRPKTSATGTPAGSWRAAATPR